MSSPAADNVDTVPNGQCIPTRKEPIWPAAVITFGLSLTAAWVILLGYGLVKLAKHAI